MNRWPRLTESGPSTCRYQRKRPVSWVFPASWAVFLVSHCGSSCVAVRPCIAVVTDAWRTGLGQNKRFNQPLAATDGIFATAVPGSRRTDRRPARLHEPGLDRRAVLRAARPPVQRGAAPRGDRSPARVQHRSNQPRRRSARSAARPVGYLPTAPGRLRPADRGRRGVHGGDLRPRPRPASSGPRVSQPAGCGPRAQAASWLPARW